MKLVFLFCEYLYLNKKRSITITQNTDDYKDIKKRQFSKKLIKLLKAQELICHYFIQLIAKKFMIFVI